MDGESSYESDISESWSLIDVNTNEELLSVTETPELEKTPVTELKNVQSRKTSDLELKDFVQKCKEIYKTDFGHLHSSDSNSSFVNEGFVSCSYKEAEGICSPCKGSEDDDGQNDSDDIESIEVLDLDGNYRESEMDRPDSVADSQDSQTYQSDDEESLEENISNESRSNSLTVIKRKRRKFCKNAEGAVNNVNSEDRSPGECGLKTCSSEAEKINDKSEEQSCRGSSHPVHKLYGNNVAYKVLGFSVGVIFAGVACIAIAHFLGVQDGGAETTGELVETLKKLQVENAALQSRLFHLNRALLNREPNSKPGLPPNRIPCKEAEQFGTSKAAETDLNRAALSEIRSSLNSIEWLSKLEDLVRNDNKASESGIDFDGFGKYIHDQLTFLRKGKEGGVKLLEGTDRKIVKVLQKIVTRLLTSQENVENLYERLMSLKNKLNHKLKKILPDAPEETEEEKSKFLRRVPVTELDLQSAQWDSDEKAAENSLREYPRSIVVYRFPQPEKYYQVEVRGLESPEGKSSRGTNSSETLKKGVSDEVEETGKKDNKRNKRESEKRKHKKRGKVNRKKEGPREREFEDESKEERKKRTVKKSVVSQPEKGKKKKTKVFGSEAAKVAFRPNANELGSLHSKVQAEVMKGKKLKKVKKWKSRKSSPSKLRTDAQGEKKHSGVCWAHECLNSTGYWMFRWANGRDEFRRYERRGDWQFKRAKGRKELRDDDHSVNWQLKRALGRESNRDGGRWPRGRRTRLNGKEFFHDRFSWI